MPNDNDRPNGKKPPDSLHFERSQVTCQRCKRKFDNFLVEEIEDLAQLRCGSVLIASAELVCLHCGWVFHWDMKRRDLEKMAIKYGELMGAIKGYNPE